MCNERTLYTYDTIQAIRWGYATVDDSYTIAQSLAHLPGGQKVPGPDHGGVA